jgi:uncharacterized protein (DUF1330 family)
MPAYVIVNIDITDPVRFEEYRRLAAPTVAAFGGRYIVRGGRTEILEGDWTPHRVVILEFPTFARAKEWWSCPEYVAIMKIRHESAQTDMILVEGM